jgi:hypothetical protein
MPHVARTLHTVTGVRHLAAGVATALLTLVSGAGSLAAPADASLGVSDGQDAYTVNAATGAPSTLAAGRTPGEFGVAQSGASTYRIPVWTPPGVGDVELELALQYNSRASNGLLGVGWSLAGLSTITRCNRTWVQDGAAGAVRNVAGDRYCLDGQQLKLVSGTAGTDGAVYATEIETFSRVVASGAMGNGPASFTVTSKNGLVYEYGSNASSRVYAGSTGTVRTWALSRIHDRASASGNSIALTYDNDAAAGSYGNGSFRIAAITYPTTATGAGPFYTVKFTYSARPANDVPSGYLAGSRVREPNQLDMISVQAVGDATPIKTYNLSYAAAPVTRRERLASVQECSAASCLRPTTISYQDGASGWQSMQEAGVSAAGSTPPLSFDLNGDGLTDLLYPVAAGAGKVSWRIALATLTGYAASIDTGFVTASNATLIPGQFVGNARTQVLIPLNNVWYVAGYAGTGFTSASTGLAVNGEYAAADLDGDGLADLISQIGVGDPSIAIRRNVTVPVAGTFVARFSTTFQEIYFVPGGRKAALYDNVRVADFNGDGRADIVVLTHVSSDIFAQQYAQPLLSNGFGVPFTAGVEEPLMPGAMVSLADWNADGCSDLVQVYSVYVSDCAGSLNEIRTGATTATGASLLTVLPADWNGDGRSDLLYVDS